MSALAEQSPAIPKPAARCAIARRVTLALLLALAATGMVAWFAREPLLRSAADLWIVSDPLAPADAVAVLGGGLETRPFIAADYYRRGLAKKVLISNIRESRAEQLGVVMSHLAANRQVLLRLGVPESDIGTFGANLSSTREEALALREWAQRTGSRSLIVPTEIFSARRVRWILHRVLGDAVTVRVAALDPTNYRRDDWWREVEGLVAFQNEVVKYLYYRVKY